MSFVSRFFGLFRRRLDGELDAELRSHLEMRAELNLAAGMSPEDARRDALRRFGNPACVKEETRRADILPWLETLLQDLRYAARTFAKRPASRPLRSSRWRWVLASTRRSSAFSTRCCCGHCRSASPAG